MASRLNLPNSITIARILLVPVFIAVLFAHPDKSDWQRWIAVFLFVLAISTDGVDGAIARKRGLVTNLGKILDPIADKALLGGALVSLSLLGEVPWWATIVILLREVGITVYRLVVVRKRVIAASGGGKAKTILQSITVGFLLSPFDSYFSWLGFIETLALYAAVAVTVVTGLQYVFAAIKSAKNV